MRTSDVELVALNEAAAQLHPWTKRIFLDCLRSGYQCWVLANKQRIVAHGVMSVAIGECHLLTLCVHPEYQRRGFARKLFKLLLDRAYKQEAETCFLEVRRSNESAAELYRSMGFVEIGERKNYYPGKGEREDALIMSRDLPLP
ncbi:MAG: ribosomal protein S18-alanine N-acetyltransferase [Pseudohongiellaceae bacterium]